MEALNGKGGGARHAMNNATAACLSNLPRKYARSFGFTSRASPFSPSLRQTTSRRNTPITEPRAAETTQMTNRSWFRATSRTVSRSFPIGTNRKEESATDRRKSPIGPSWIRRVRRWRTDGLTRVYGPRGLARLHPQRNNYAGSESGLLPTASNPNQTIG